MLNFEKLNIFKIDKEMKSEISTHKEDGERTFTFKITKKRTPWIKEEDDAITALVNKYGTGNWTVIANEMGNTYGFNNRSGKQCRERWHNHLDPEINKDYWSEKEENILFMKHTEYGNKWSDIAKYLPGRTDNAIKNHFYSKLRKFIRKILKQLNRDNLIKNNGIDPNKYNSDKLYKMIKRNKIPYDSLNKESILNMIIHFEKASKGGKLDNLLLKKTVRKKGCKPNLKENLYSEKIKKRNDQIHLNKNGHKILKRNKSRPLIYKNFNSTKNRTLKISLNNNNKSNCRNCCETKKPNIMNNLGRSRRTLRKKQRKVDYIYSDDSDDNNKVHDDHAMVIENNKSSIYTGNFNIIINKSILNDNYGKVDEDKNSQSSIKSDENSTKNDLYIPKLETYESFKNHLNNQSTSYNYPMPMLSAMRSTTSNYYQDDRFYRHVQFDYPYMDQTNPLISPINPNTKLYPPSTKNYFNIDLLHEGTPFNYQNYNIFKSNMYNHQINNVTTPTLGDKIMPGIFSQPYTPNKEVALHNKILINENLMDAERSLTPTFKETIEKTEIILKEEDNIYKGDPLVQSQNEPSMKKKNLKRPSIDINVVNSTETGKIFYSSITKSFNNIYSSSQDKKEDIVNKIKIESIEYNPTVNNISTCAQLNETKEEEGSATNESDKSGNILQNNIDSKITLMNKSDAKSLTVTPKSAFVKINK